MYKINKRKQRKSFTLIEILLVVVILSVVSLVVYSAFSQGINLWERLTQRTPVSELNMFFGKMESDLRNNFKFFGIDFAGAEDQISFATLIVSAAEKQQRTLSVGEVGYSFDASTKSLNRWQKNYSQVYSGKFPFLLRQMVKNVKSVRFKYYSYDSKQKIHIWKDSWDKEEIAIPLAVRVRLEFDESAERKEIVRTITIPVGGEVDDH